MNKKNKNCAIIAAAGRGRRMGLNIDKQFVNIDDKPILYYTLNTFSKCDCIDEIIISVPQDKVEYCTKKIVDKYKIKKVKAIVTGGSERQISVFNALKVIQDCDIVLIHDGVRPFINERIIEDGIRYARMYGASACGIIPNDTIKIKNNKNLSSGTLDRNSLFCVQTPQCFKYNLILSCHKMAASSGLKFTDDTSVVEAYGNKVYLYDGSSENIKITTKSDLVMANELIKHHS